MHCLEEDIFAAGLHGDMKQAQRDRVMQGFRSGKTDILVCRKMWRQEGLTWMMWKQYLIMISRRMMNIMYTALAEPDVPDAVGRSFSFVSGREVYKLKEIQRYCKTKIYAQKVPSLNDVANTKMEMYGEDRTDYRK